ncbi:MAG TPA: thiol:disulfide interchange protein DsbG [Steroidobacteraceae bacterium]|nr:thiol:disulfide interchange protein DsbG [Steroidobacteraceae bacterium]
MKPSPMRRCLAGLGMLLIALPVFAATRSSSPALPPTLTALVKAGKVKVVNQFATDVPGLTGYIVTNQDGTQVVYGDDGYLIVGHVISPKGTDLTDDYRNRYSPKADLAGIVGKLDAGGHLINEGRTTAPLLYVFADPNCIFCYHFYKMAEPLVASGRLRLRWVMVAFLQSSSGPKAAAILSATDPRSALHADEDRFDVTHESGGVAPAAGQDKALQGLLQAHVTALEVIGAGSVGTPTLLYRDAHGRWAAQIGLPPADWLSQYAQGKPLPAS